MGAMREDLLTNYGRMPVIRPLPVKPPDRRLRGKKPRYQLLNMYRFDDESGREWTIRPGYVYDGASIPTLTGLTWVATYSKFDPRVMRAALVHDYFCDTRPPKLNYLQAADLFHKMLLEDGAGKWKARTMVRAVKMFGPKWE